MSDQDRDPTDPEHQPVLTTSEQADILISKYIQNKESYQLFDLQTEPEKLSETHRWTSQPCPQETTTVLEPGHPLLDRFQKALRDHLLKRIEKLSAEVGELDFNLKEEEKLREDLGVQVYDRQQQVCQLQRKVDTTEKELEDVLAVREQQDKELRELRKLHAEQYKLYVETTEKEKKLRTEMESLSLLEQQLLKWKQEMESDLAVSQRISDKTVQEKKILTQEKRELDVFVYKLMTDVFKCESEIELLDAQLRVQEKKRDELGYSTQETNSNLEAIHSQQKSLIAAWNNVLLALKKRDTKYAQASDQVKTLTEELRTHTTEIEVLKKNIEKEMRESLKVAERKSRMDVDYNSAVTVYRSEEQKLSQLTEELGKLQTIMEITTKDLEAVYTLKQAREKEMKRVVKEVDRQASIKVNLEDQIMKALDTCVTNDKASIYMSKTLKKLRHECRELELTMLNCENSDAQLLVEIEHQKGINEATREYMDNMKKNYQERDQFVNKLQLELTQLENLTALKQRNQDQLSRKVTEAYEKNGSSVYTPQEMRIMELERNIGEKNDEIQHLEGVWMREQNHVVGLTDQRNEQLQNINLLNKQIMIVRQKKIQLEDEIEKHNAREREMVKSTERLTKKLEKLNADVARSRSLNTHKDYDVNLAQLKYADQLKELQTECGQLEIAIEDLELEKKSLTKQLIELNQAGLSWQRQTQMAVETRKATEMERATGDVQIMKNEIHRMQVRYGQLRKVQEHLVRDLEQTVNRRQHVIDMTEAKIKTKPKGLSQIRMHFCRKICEVCDKIKKLKREIKEHETEIDLVNERQRQLRTMCDELRKEFERLEDSNAVLQEKLADGEMKKHMNLEKLITRQRRARCLDDIAKGKFKSRPANIVDIEIMKQTELKQNLYEIAKQLRIDYPQHIVALKKVMATLDLKTLEV